MLHTMNKKTYIKPELEVVEIESVEVIATSIPLVEEDGAEQLTNNYRPRRGKWGNLWSTEE